MALTHLLPSGIRRRLRRLRQDVTDLATALQVARRPVARTGALSNPEIYHVGATSADSNPPQSPAVESLDTAGSPNDAPATVVFADHDAEIAVGPDQTILEAGLEAGLDLDFSCTVGGCAACALQLVEGEVVYDGPTCLSPAERDQGMCLACVGRPNGTIVVESL
jgi:ferredoxin